MQHSRTLVRTDYLLTDLWCCWRSSLSVLGFLVEWSFWMLLDQQLFHGVHQPQPVGFPLQWGKTWHPPPGQGEKYSWSLTVTQLQTTSCRKHWQSWVTGLLFSSKGRIPGLWSPAILPSRRRHSLFFFFFSKIQSRNDLNLTLQGNFVSKFPMKIKQVVENCTPLNLLRRFAHLNVCKVIPQVEVLFLISFYFHFD